MKCFRYTYFFYDLTQQIVIRKCLKMKKTSKAISGNQSLISSFFKKLPPESASTIKPEQNVVDLLNLNEEPEYIEVTPDVFVNNGKRPKKFPTRKHVDVVSEETIFQTPKKQRIKSPTKTAKSPHKTPVKLFTKTPTKKKTPNKSSPNSNEFKVEVLKNFLRITPIKCKENDNTGTDKMNRGTPEKSSNDCNEVKTCLDFTDCRTPLKEFNGEWRLEKKVSDIFLDDAFNDSWDESFNYQQKIDDYTLNLNAHKFCKVISIDTEKNCITLTLNSIDNTVNEQAKCILKDFWINCVVEVGSKIYVEAKQIGNEWFVTKDYGLIVFEPDYLISCTSVGKALFCKRQTVLSQYYKYNGGNKYFVIGILVHELLEKVLKANIKTLKGIENLAKNLLNKKETVLLLYSCTEDEAFIKEQFQQYVPQVFDLMNKYVHKKTKQKSIKGNWNGSIDSIEDIEENIWCKELGLKGKVDVTIKSNNHIMPLELKTGRSTMSLEHRTQMLLYVMMMNKVGYNVNSSLLLYLKDGTFRDFPYNANSTKDVLLVRNELAFYLTRKVKTVKDQIKESINIKLPKLPEPINDNRNCKRCDYNIICSAYSKRENYNVSDSYKEISLESLSHLNDSHIDYFLHWVSLVHLEGMANNFKEVKEIYTVPPLEREKNLQCIANLKLVKVEARENDLYEHVFSKQEGNLMSSTIIDGNYVVVSTNKRPAVASGTMHAKESTSAVVILDRDLSTKYTKETFHLDTYESRNSDIFNMTNLALLLEANKEADRLRKLIIDKQQPLFEDQLPKSVVNSCVSILKDLNRNQKRAVLKAMMAKDYLLIKGMPGTGKTSTIVALIQCLIKLNKTVLITSHTHSSVDNVCVKLADKGVQLLRLGAQSRVHKNLINKYSENALTKHCSTVKELEDVYNSVQVVAVTCLGATHVLFTKRTFDYCIVDESTQVLQPSIIRGLTYAKTFVLIGDPDQLEPVVRNPSANQLGFSESLFERLSTPQSCVSLTDNYRMNRTITACANALTYNGELIVANDQIGSQTLELPQLQKLELIYNEEPWIGRALDLNLEASVRIIDTGPVWNRVAKDVDDDDANQCFNNYEVIITERLVDALIKGGLTSNKIGIISPYKAQVTNLLSNLSKYHVEVSTVDQYQGRDKHVIIYSCTRSSDPTKPRPNIKNELLENKRRLTVALTRAKVKFILIADLATVKAYTPFAILLNGMDSFNIIELNDVNSGFKWECVL